MSETVKRDMCLLCVILLDDACLENVVLALTGVSGGLVTMVDAVSGMSNLSQAIPMFAEIVGTKGKRFCKILVTCVEGESPLQRFFDILSAAGIDRNECGICEAFSVSLTVAVVLESLDVL